MRTVDRAASGDEVAFARLVAFSSAARTMAAPPPPCRGWISSSELMVPTPNRRRRWSVERIYPFQVLLPAALTGLAQDSKAQAEQVRSLAVERLGRHVGRLPVSLVHRLDEALRLHLAL